MRGLASLADRRRRRAVARVRRETPEEYEQGKANSDPRPPQINLLLELVTALGGFRDESVLPFVHRLRAATGAGAATEIETMLVRAGEKEFWVGLDDQALAPSDWRKAALLAQTLAEFGSEPAKAALLKMWEQAEQGKIDARVMPALFRALNRIKFDGLQSAARRQLTSKEITVRAAAASLLTDLNDENFTALTQALEQSKSDKLNDARLALLGAIGKYKTPQAVNAVKPSLGDPDQRSAAASG